MLVGMTILAGVLLGGMVATCGYQYLAIAATERDIAEQRAALATAKRRTAELVALQVKSAALVKQMAHHPASWSWSAQLPQMVAQVSALTAGSHAEIDALQPAPVAVNAQLARFPLRLTLHTDIDSLVTILRRVRQSAPVLAVDQLAIRVGAKPDDPLQVQLTVSSYVMLEGHAGAGGKP